MAVLRAAVLILLGILGLVLLIVLLVLFVPIRFRVHGALEDGKAGGRLKVTWLLHFVRLDLLAEGSEISDPAVRTCGIPLKIKESDQDEDTRTDGENQKEGR